LTDNSNQPIKFFKYFRLPFDADSKLILSNQHSIWNRYNYAEGIVDVFGFAPDLISSNFPLRGSFIPFWHRLIYSTGKRINTSVLTTADSWTKRLSTKQINSQISMVQPDGSGLMLLPDEEFEIYVENFTKIGFHIIRSGESVIDEVAVNIPGVELTALMMPDEILIDRFNSSAVIMNDPLSIAGIVDSARKGIELWYWFLIGLVILTVLEMYLSNIYGTKSSR